MAIEPIAAPVGSFQRDFEKEQAKLEEMGVNSLQVGMLNPTTLFEATYTPEELAQLPDYLNIKGKKDAAAGAEASLLATPKPTVSGMRILENGLRAKAGIGDQAIGESDIFGQAGLSGYAVLKQSMAQRGAEMDRKYNTFANELEGVSGAFRDTYNLALDRYNVLQAAYKEETDRFNSVIDDLMDHEQSMLYLQKQFDLNKELAGFKAGLKDEPALPGSGSSLDTGTPSIVGEYENKITGKGTITGHGSFRADGTEIWAPGLDVHSAPGSSVRSPGKGVVVGMVADFTDPGEPLTQSDQNSGFGNQVVIELEDGNIIFLSHLDTVNGNYTVGSPVNPGDVIGTLGRTGTTAGVAGYHVDITMGPKSNFLDDKGNLMTMNGSALISKKGGLWDAYAVDDYVAGQAGTFEEGVLEGFKDSPVFDFLPDELKQDIDKPIIVNDEDGLAALKSVLSKKQTEALAAQKEAKEDPTGLTKEEKEGYVKAGIKTYYDQKGFGEFNPTNIQIQFVLELIS